MTWNLDIDTVLGSIARDKVPWSHAWIADYPTFAERFTLHDSLWVGIFLALRDGNEAVLVLEWDAHWLPEPFREQCIQDSGRPPGFANPFLLIRLSRLRDVQLRGYEEPLSGRAISSAEWVVGENGQALSILDIMGAEVRLYCDGQMEWLAFSRGERMLDLKKVEQGDEPLS